MKGRKPKTTAAHKRDGTTVKVRHADRVPDAAFPDAKIECPPELSGPAALIWHQVIAALPTDQVKQADVSQLAGLCHWYGEFQKVNEAIAELEVIDPAYYRLMTLAAIAWKHFAAASSRFGMTPVDRARMKMAVETKVEDDALETLKLIGAG